MESELLRIFLGLSFEQYVGLYLLLHQSVPFLNALTRFLSVLKGDRLRRG